MLPIHRIELPGTGPEDIAVLPDGSLITGLADGRLFKISQPELTSPQIEMLHHFQGRPLGIEVMDESTLIICDGELGELISFDLKSHRHTRLADRFQKKKLRFCNNASVCHDGRIFFSCSSAYYPVSRWQRDLLRHTESGALYCRFPDGELEQLASDLGFANGVALLPDKTAVLVAETAHHRIMKVCLSTKKISRFAITAGSPDNLSVGDSGILWAAIASPVDTRLNLVHHLPAIVRYGLAQTLGRITLPVQRSARVQGFDMSGRLVHDLILDKSQYSFVTGVREHNGYLYLGSLMESAIARVKIPALSL